MSRYRISPVASRDLNTIADYYMTRNVEAGEMYRIQTPPSRPGLKITKILDFLSMIVTYPA